METTGEQLVGRRFPNVSLPATTGMAMSAEDFASGSFVLFIYPRTGRPDRAEPPEWALVPGAKGCTPESCEFRDLAADYAALGFRIYGLSSQDTDYQREAVDRLHLPYPLLSDSGFTLATELGLPTFEFGGDRLHVRSTLVVTDGTIAHAYVGVSDAAAHPRRLLAQLKLSR
ncbi:peroxiredoxin [Paeniglutamicibacter sp. MACA_103]|uniref:peroxiredoxin n=1 Tax=Paeniglutamicibacter sp. MACA_103 TaxID=3377337 RepID=UPI003894419B